VRWKWWAGRQRPAHRGTTDIRLANVEQAPALGALIATSFAGMNTTDWIFSGDREAQVPVLGAQFALLVEHALKFGTVYTAAGGAGVAVWFDNTQEYPWIEGYDERLQEIAGPHYPRVSALDSAFSAHHPHDPHHHLALLAVHPDRQDRGIGSALLAHHHAILDREGIPAFLETSTDNAKALYQRHGYQPLPSYDLPDGGPAFHPMWRPVVA
jgi:ribosomal protein S18 acetylase RimI-like enzyme